MKKCVLLVWDIGTWANWRYHVGDESMFAYNCTQLKQHGYTVYYTSRCQDSNDPFSYSDIYFRWKIAGAIYLFFACLLGNYFPKHTKVAKLVRLISQVDDVIISWWGNINSIWVWHLYYRFFISRWTQRKGKKLYFSAQTLWPIPERIFRRLLNSMLNWAQVIFVRDISYSLKLVPAKLRYKVRTSYDDALQRLPSWDRHKRMAVTPGALYIWLSLHQGEWWETYKQQLISLLEKLLQDLWTKQALEVHIIPHVLSQQHDEDLAYTQDIISHLGRWITVRTWEYQSLAAMSDQFGLAGVVESLSGSMHLNISTRYHWAVFALKYAVPAIMIWRSTYELEKFNGLADSLWIYRNYIIDLREKKLTTLNTKQLGAYQQTLQEACSKINQKRFFVHYYLSQEYAEASQD